MAEAPAPAPDTMGRRAMALFAAYRARLALIALAILTTSALGVVTPFLTQLVFDHALSVPDDPRLELLAWLVGAMIAIAVVSAAIGIGQTYLTTLLGNEVMRSLRDRLFAHLTACTWASSRPRGPGRSSPASATGGVDPL